MIEGQFLLYSESKPLANALSRYLNNSERIENHSISIDTLSIPLSRDGQKEPEVKKEDASLFRNKLAVLYPSVAAPPGTDGEWIDPRLKVFDWGQRTVNVASGLEDIAAAIKSYLAFYRVVIDQMEVLASDSKIKLLWNDFDVDFSVKEKRVYFFNIHLGTEELWHRLGRNLFDKGLNQDQFFVFYAYVGEDTAPLAEKSFEVRDWLFGCSKFLRDFLKARGKAFEISIPRLGLNGYDEDSLRMEINGRIARRIKPNSIQAGDIAAIVERMNSSLKYIYNRNFEVEKFVGFSDFGTLSRLYLHNKNKHFRPSTQLEKNVPEEVGLRDSSTHGLSHRKDQVLGEFTGNQDVQPYQKLGWSEFLDIFYRDASSLLRAMVNYRPVHDLKFLFIDDNPDSLFQDKLRAIRPWYDDARFYYTESFEWRDSLLGRNVNGTDQEVTLTECPLTFVELDEVVRPKEKNIKSLNPDFLVVDLEYNGQLVGFDLLRRLTSELRKEGLGSTRLIAFSRYESPYIIRTAMNNGALFYVTKEDFLRIIYQVFRLRSDDYERQVTDHNYANWFHLDKLEPSKVMKLKSYLVSGKEYEIAHRTWDSGDSRCKLSPDYKWIHKLPKADLHCHIGSCLGSELLPMTAATVLTEKYGYPLPEDRSQIIEKIIRYLAPIAADPFLKEPLEATRRDDCPDIYKRYKEDLLRILSMDYTEDSVNSPRGLFQTLAQFLGEYRTTPEEVILDPHNRVLERLYDESKGAGTGKVQILDRRAELRNSGVKYPEVMLCFVLMIHYRESQNFETLRKSVAKHLADIPFGSESIKRDVDRFLEGFAGLVAGEFKSSGFGSLDREDGLLSFLQSARSPQRCLSENESGLFPYLRGAEYGGAPHLQTKTAIYLATKYIVQEYAVKNHIRYLGLRCSVDGYSQMKLQSESEAMEALLTGFDYFTEEAMKRGVSGVVHVNISLTAKRHKTEEEFEHNVNLAIKYRYGLALTKEHYEKLTGSLQRYFKFPTRVASFDLAGIEKGNRPSKFEKQFQPLLRSCFPITIHAGEEDDAEAIWEAIYKVHSQGIGHGLSLFQHRELRDLIKERHIVLELCPTSNYLTRGPGKKYSFPQGSEGKALPNTIDETKYPLKEYLSDGMDVTVNSDNPVINSTDLTEEYLFAAKLVGGLTKWEILRLIKNGFKGAPIPKKEKKMLMDEIDDEVYEILLNEERED